MRAAVNAEEESVGVVEGGIRREGARRRAHGRHCGGQRERERRVVHGDPEVICAGSPPFARNRANARLTMASRGRAHGTRRPTCGVRPVPWARPRDGAGSRHAAWLSDAEVDRKARIHTAACKRALREPAGAAKRSEIRSGVGGRLLHGGGGTAGIARRWRRHGERSRLAPATGSSRPARLGGGLGRARSRNGGGQRRPRRGLPHRQRRGDAALVRDAMVLFGAMRSRAPPLVGDAEPLRFALPLLSPGSRSAARFASRSSAASRSRRAAASRVSTAARWAAVVAANSAPRRRISSSGPGSEAAVGATRSARERDSAWSPRAAPRAPRSFAAIRSMTRSSAGVADSLHPRSPTYPVGHSGRPSAPRTSGSPRRWRGSRRSRAAVEHEQVPSGSGTERLLSSGVVVDLMPAGEGVGAVFRLVPCLRSSWARLAPCWEARSGRDVVDVV